MPAAAGNAPGNQPLSWPTPQREHAFLTWLQTLASRYGLQTTSLRPASADASFRRYFRVDASQHSLIIMDAPPQQEDSQPFVRVAGLMAAAGLHVPRILEWHRGEGFLLLSDLGARTMLEVIQPDNASTSQGLYLQAVDDLVLWQQASRAGVLPAYDEPLLRRELELFPAWYLQQHLGLVLTDGTRQTLEKAFASIVAHNLGWPSVYVHRDFMPRNLIVADPAATGQTAQRLGVLDFQDAVYGPITYDIASLMRDAFLSWDEEFVLDITIRYWEKARRAGLPVGSDFGEFYRGVEWMGLQRHLKVAGIFARLSLRDGKPRYLVDTPRFIAYIHATASRYRELKPLLRLIEQATGMNPVTGFAYGRV